MLSAFRCFPSSTRLPAAFKVKDSYFRTFASQSVRNRFSRTTNPLGQQQSNGSSRSFTVGRNLRSEKFEVETRVAKDVILFKFENPRFFKMLNVFSLSQFAFWSYLSYCATTLRNIPVKDDPNTPWWQTINLGEKKYKIGICVVSFIIGWGTLAASWFYTLKAVRYLILRKGGSSVSFVCYTPFGQNRITTVPLKHVSCPQSRQACKAQLPLKVKSFMMHYVLDMKGEFRNIKLFDNTVGLKRNLK